MVEKYQMEKVKISQLIFNAVVADKTVRKFSNTCGAIYLPRKFIGKRFRMILIPLEAGEEAIEI